MLTMTANSSSFRIEVIKGSNSLRLHKPENFPSIIQVFTNKIVVGRSATVDQVIYLYGNDEDNRGGLLVTECKENEVTVVHYFVICRERFNFNFISETDIGLSVVAKFKASNGSLDVTVEGPDAHPPSALVYMFDVVKKTRTWNPSMCPHCGDNNGDSNSHGSQSIVVINNHGNLDGYGHGSYIENIRFH
ncbi:uncharacterized protein LOC109801460 isoform X2 [Cajanus cajan]|uniref:uncharacterized protein LOC109801460 isoform X2 n=1 Tax=Cajanus cajan TaxID=3821 RepID=UPI0010FBBD15|nr:uncharacterized protein LOC109801460 isoform X2 [Cajanus cajan]